VGIALGGDEIAQEDSVEDWITRSMNRPFQAVLAKMVQVILGWRGQELHMAARENWTEKESRKEAKKHFSLKGHVRIEPQGLSTWGVRAGHLCSIMETRKMDITLHDTSGRAHRIQVEGNKSLLDLENVIRDAWKLETWVKAPVMQADKALFWADEKADFTVVTQYEPSLDPRPEISVRIYLTDRSFVVENYRAPEEPATLLEDLSSKYGFPLSQKKFCDSPI
jgi:hypothetical protein